MHFFEVFGTERTSTKEKISNNYIEFCSKTGTPNPVTQEYILGTRFACETFISQRSKDSSDDPSGNGNASTNADANSDPSVNGIPFGGRDKLFPSKKAARHNAAAEAVAWLKENGYYSTVTGKPVARPDKGRKGGSDKNGGGSGGNEDGNEEDSGYVGMKKGMSYGQMVAGMSVSSSHQLSTSFHSTIYFSKILACII